MQRKFLKKLLGSVETFFPELKVMYMDESFFKTSASLTHTWGDREQRKVVNVTSNQGSLTVIGAIDPKVGDHDEWIYDVADSRTVNSFLWQLSARYPDIEILLVMDNASFHKSQGSEQYPIPKNIHILFQPPYSPDVNYQEIVWKISKESYFKNRLCKSFEELSQTVEEIFRNLRDHRFIFNVH